MGNEADYILRGLNLNRLVQKQYVQIKDGFHAFFIVKKNVIYERDTFKVRIQGENETADYFVTVLYALAEYCNYRLLHDELIWACMHEDLCPSHCTLHGQLASFHSCRWLLRISRNVFHADLPPRFSPKTFQPVC